MSLYWLIPIILVAVLAALYALLRWALTDRGGF